MEIKWTKDAQFWMKEIFDFHAEKNRELAEKVTYDIIGEVELLTDFPGMGQRLLSWPDKEIRMIIFGNYRIIYYVKEKSIDILAVFHKSFHSYERHINVDF